MDVSASCSVGQQIFLVATAKGGSVLLGEQSGGVGTVSVLRRANAIASADGCVASIHVAAFLRQTDPSRTRFKGADER